MKEGWTRAQASSLTEEADICKRDACAPVSWVKIALGGSLPPFLLVRDEPSGFLNQIIFCAKRWKKTKLTPV